MNGILLPLTQAFGQQVAETQNQVSDGERIQFFIDQGYRAVSRADAINGDLTVILLDIGPPEPALKKVKTDLTGNQPGLKYRKSPACKDPAHACQERSQGPLCNLPGYCKFPGPACGSYCQPEVHGHHA